MRLGHRIQLKSDSKDASGNVKSLLDSLSVTCSRSSVDGDVQVGGKNSLRNEEVVVYEEQPQAF
jgi:hypothetical protein